MLKVRSSRVLYLGRGLGCDVPCLVSECQVHIGKITKQVFFNVTDSIVVQVVVVCTGVVA